MDKFEEMIVNEMVNNFEISNKEAILIVSTYLPVICLLNDNHDSVRIQSERYFKAYMDNISPDDWIDKIYKLRTQKGSR